jgi:hypothetical protein
VDVGGYREEAMAQGYEGERVDRLVEKWKLLLDKARSGGA